MLSYRWRCSSIPLQQCSTIQQCIDGISKQILTPLIFLSDELEEEMKNEQVHRTLSLSNEHSPRKVPDRMVSTVSNSNVKDVESQEKVRLRGFARIYDADIDNSWTADSQIDPQH